MQKIRLFLIIFFSLLFTNLSECKVYALDSPKLIFFHSPTCHSCVEAKNEIIPVIEMNFKDQIEIEYRSIDNIENYKFLLSLIESEKKEIKAVVPTFYFNGRFFVGKKEAEEKLADFIAESLHLPYKERSLPEVSLIERFKTFGPLVIAAAGLIDGVNPCAFTVIVFFVSFLALQGYRKRDLAIVCPCFILAVFITYFLIGLGLFGVLYSLRGFWVIARVFNYLIGGLSIVLGCLALYDYFKFKKTQETDGLILQLPLSIKNRIHSVIGAHYRGGQVGGQGVIKRNISKLVVSAFITGFLVSILEGICTGQTYLPTISFVLKTTHLKIQAFIYLILYNIMFIVPLVAIFLLALLGVTSGQFSKFLKKNLGTVKILMAVLFFALGIFLIWRG
ncbi:MAG: hypothetical protein ABIH19_01560 [Candidatus Omnitrophota bacterium]